MNAIRQTQQLNKRELENAIPPSASWHVDYRDTAWIYVGGIPLDLSEGDVMVIFSQFGNPTHLNLIRDRETGKSKGFGFLKYEDQRSCDLAVDNLTGADVLGRMLRVDHTRYKRRDDEDEDTWRIDRLEAELAADANGNRKRASDTEESEDEKQKRKKRRPMLKEEKELERMLAIKENGEDEDPMKDYLINEKREEVRRARDRDTEREKRHKHRHRHKEDDKKERTKHRERRREEREEVDNVRRDRKEHKRREESVDSDGDTFKRSSGRDRRKDESRNESRHREQQESRPKRIRHDSRTDYSSPERQKRRDTDDRSRRRGRSND